MSISHEPCFEVATGSIPGRAHVGAGRNNQDAAAWRLSGSTAVAVVCDGCSTGAFSELGARLGAEFLCELAHRRLLEGRSPDAPDFWSSLTEALISELRRVIEQLGGDAARRVEDAFLFTVVGAVATADGAWLFVAGDGSAVVDGSVRTFGPFPDNAPPYLGYRLLGGRTTLAVEKIDVCDSLILATDGAADLEDLPSFAHDERLFRNRDGLRRRLAVQARSGLSLHDDVTVLVLRRRKGG